MFKHVSQYHRFDSIHQVVNRKIHAFQVSFELEYIRFDPEFKIPIEENLQ